MRISDWSSDVCSSDLAGVNYLALDIFRPTPPSPTTEFIVNNFLGGVWPVRSLSDTLYGDKSEALFANISYELDHLSSALSGLTLNAGYRYTWDEPSGCRNGRTSISLDRKSPRRDSSHECAPRMPS